MRRRAEIGFIASTLLLVGALATAGCGEENGVPPAGPPIVNDAGLDASRDSEKDVDVDGDAPARSDRADVSDTTDTTDVSNERESGVREGGDGDATDGDAD